MVPVAFGSSGHELFGAYHPASPGGDGRHRAIGVVLCNPGGWEAIASQRSNRALADQLSAEGFPVLRYDHAGTGDSAGTDLDPDRVRAWLEGVSLAVGELKRLSGVPDVSLFGIQLGATLAAEAAIQRRDPSVRSVVLWAPCLTGKAYLRQMRAYRMLNDPSAKPDDAGDEEAAGFILTRSTLEDLQKIDLLARATPPATDVLLLARDGQSPEEKLASRWRGQGARADVTTIPGYLPMMQEPRKSVVPQAVFDAVTRWLLATHPALVDAPTSPAPSQSAAFEAGGVREEARFLGRHDRIFGIVTHPRSSPERTLPALIWLNTASDHRVGPNRLYVPLARRAALEGFTSVRFDPTGVGDGEPSHSPETEHAYSQRRIRDVREVMTWLSVHRGLDRFVLVGLCSAAYVAFHAAHEDPRIVGEILINPQTFAWREGDSLDLSVRRSYGSNRFYKRQILNVDTWQRALRGEVNVRGVAAIVGKRLATLATRRARRLLPFQSGETLDVERAFRQKLRRGTDVLMIFSENDGGLDYIEGEIGWKGAALRRAKRFRFEIASRADHTFSQRAAKDWLSSLIIDHLRERFGGLPERQLPASQRLRPA